MDALDLGLLKLIAAQPRLVDELVDIVDGYQGHHDPLVHDIPSARPSVERALQRLVEGGWIDCEHGWCRRTQRGLPE